MPCWLSCYYYLAKAAFLSGLVHIFCTTADKTHLSAANRLLSEVGILEEPTWFEMIVNKMARNYNGGNKGEQIEIPKKREKVLATASAKI